jgi:RNA polymerase sigma-70 factor (ECF subfamily)
MAEPESFAVLLQRARLGDADALASIARSYEKDLRIAARVHLGSALRPYLDSLDLVQSVHRSLMLGLRSSKFDVSSPEKLIALALTMVRRKVAHQWRRHRRQSRSNDSVLDLFAQQCRPCDQPAPRAELRDTIETLWNRLSDDERTLIELRLLGHSNVEAARILGQPAETIRVRLFRLRQRLQADAIEGDWLV